MELWIRSQDRERLIKVFDVFVDDERIRANFQSHFSGCNYVELGEYYSNDRALEVLDEIQNIIKQQLMFHIDKSQCNTIEDIANPKFIIRDVGIPRVYEMPKE